MNLFDSIQIRLEENPDVSNCSDLIENYDFSEYLNLINIKGNNKNYYKNTIFKNEIFELVIIKWDKDSETTIHNHPNNGCLLKPIYGKLNEIQFLNSNDKKNTELKINQVYYMHDNIGKHKIISKETSYSIHLYSPPNFYN